MSQPLMHAADVGYSPPTTTSLTTSKAGLATSPAAAPALLRASGLTLIGKQLSGKHSRAEVLRDIDFALLPGRTLGLVGESGAGKSMIGRVIARQLPDNFEVQQGRLEFDGADLLRMPPEQHRALLGRKIAFIPQEPMTALNPVMTIGEQFAEHLQRLGVPKSLCRERSIEALAEVLLPDPVAVLGKYAFQLSGGMCQRVMIAMAFAGDPALVISDEATTALDVSTQAHIVTLIRGLQQRRGTGVIFVTHDLGLASHVCDDLVVLYAGEVVERGPAKIVSTRSLHPYTRALQRANPQLTGPRRQLPPLPGHMPGITDFAALPGCRFQPRCAVATESCCRPVALRDANVPQVQHSLRCVHGAAAPDPLQQPDTRAVMADGPLQSEAPFLRIHNLNKIFQQRGWRRGKDVQAVKNISFDIAPGEFVGIVGESGSGKSTLGRMIMGLETPSSGQVLLNDQRLGDSDAEWQRRISSIQMIFQDPRSALNPRRRVASLLTQSMENRPAMRNDRELRARELVASIGLAPDMLARFPSQMSGGQRQRVNIGRALCDVPQLLVADEIVSGLDVSVQAQILNLLLQLRQQHKVALLLISHDLAVVRYLCSRVLVMHRGEVVESGPTETVFAAPAHVYTRQLLAAVPPSDPFARWPQSA
ncbi:ABC transporter ATP-binding protein [Herbaspirillum lusitanum]|uniref:ABC transporter ATP-binding protein n=1 Tax=Herbaspirillum lusitanum TaxID=213312 RepID=A0ABW9A506_9BURK